MVNGALLPRPHTNTPDAARMWTLHGTDVASAAHKLRLVSVAAADS